mmetsp:Transcript_55491/g.159545  ORF Transcript_55491/g.159545 Transcript_55491/m.159545 type:complete len:233 (+) Transcript_55491:421-1119(+)
MQQGQRSHRIAPHSDVARAVRLSRLRELHSASPAALFQLLLLTVGGPLQFRRCLLLAGRRQVLHRYGGHTATAVAHGRPGEGLHGLRRLPGPWRRHRPTTGSRGADVTESRSLVGRMAVPKAIRKRGWGPRSAVRENERYNRLLQLAAVGHYPVLDRSRPSAPGGEAPCWRGAVRAAAGATVLPGRPAVELAAAACGIQATEDAEVPKALRGVTRAPNDVHDVRGRRRQVHD